MHIEWSQTQMYNTIMAVAAGIALVMLVRFGSLIKKGRNLDLEGWAAGFAVPGLILVLLGGRMTMTWPLSKVGFPFDDIIFGEPSLGFGMLLLGGAFILYRKAKRFPLREAALPESEQPAMIYELTNSLRPLSYFAAAMGLALLSIAVAGVYFKLFAAPPEEPISGRFADYPMLEATFISGLYALAGIGAILLPFSLRNSQPILSKIMGICWLVSGILLVLFGALNYFTHIGLILNTM